VVATAGLKTKPFPSKTDSVCFENIFEKDILILNLTAK
jgi:hypothetical protein